WFDYIADTGDGQMAMYSVASLCYRDLELENKHLPRGRFLFCGGDTAYHVADVPTLAAQFQAPFHWAWHDVDAMLGGALAAAPPRLLFGLPGNHDYFDELVGFNQQFRRPVNGAPLELPGFVRKQEASYVKLALPFGWRFWGIDTEKGGIDPRQREFF